MKSTIPTIYIDESGNTGSDLNNDTQKYFVLSSVSFTEEELNQIKNDIQYDKELHFIKMKKSISGRDVIKKILLHPLMDKKHVKYQFMDKNFCVYAQMTDMLIEPVAHFKCNENLYSHQGNIIIANLLYVFCENHHNKALITLLKESFTTMIRTQNEDSINEFYMYVSVLISEASDSLTRLLCLINESQDMIEDLFVEPAYSLDMTVTSFVYIVDYWSKMYNGKINVILDDSKAINANLKTINKLCAITTPCSVGYDTRKQSFPLLINKLTAVSSESEYGVQLADIIASSITFVMNDSKKFEGFQKEIKDFEIFKYPCNPIQPASAEELSKEVDSSNDIDHIDYLFNHVDY